MKKLILFELNEVPFRIIDEYCRWRPQSYLARYLPRCAQYETHTEDAGHLSPWVTWPSLHRGVADTRHAIRAFGQDLQEADRDFPPLWKRIARAGLATGVFGSLHSYPPDQEGNYAFYIPDTFAAGSECFPARLSAFQEFNLAMTQASGRNVSRQIAWRPALQLLARAPQLGLRAATLASLGNQLVAEQIEPARRTRRRTYQVVIAFDLFLRQLRRTRPAFATFFTNHVASSMHRYWAAAFPGDYPQYHYDAKWRATYGAEIEFTMDRFDGFLGRLLRFVEAAGDYKLLIASSMGQAATQAEPLSAALYITDVPRFMQALGIAPEDWQQRPAMAPDVCLVASPGCVPLLREKLRSLSIEGRPIEYIESAHGHFLIRLGTPWTNTATAVAHLGQATVPYEELGLSWVQIDDQTNTNAYHIPQGVLLVYDPDAQPASGARTSISTLDVAPMILRHFALPVPDYMRRSRLAA